VRELVCDPWRFAQAALELEGNGIGAVAFARHDARLIPASARLCAAVVEQRLTLPFDSELARHAADAIGRHSGRGWRIDKPNRRTNIDAIIAARWPSSEPSRSRNPPSCSGGFDAGRVWRVLQPSLGRPAPGSTRYQPCWFSRRRMFEPVRPGSRRLLMGLKPHLDRHQLGQGRRRPTCRRQSRINSPRGGGAPISSSPATGPLPRMRIHGLSRRRSCLPRREGADPRRTARCATCRGGVTAREQTRRSGDWFGARQPAFRGRSTPSEA
jgi:hypothetical protein